MRLVLQRVTGAAVRVGSETVGQIDRGYCLLIGMTHADTPPKWAGWPRKSRASASFPTLRAR
jgi:D-Tyr-tRNAtyr deacylase